jgi:hypothetical protein
MVNNKECLRFFTSSESLISDFSKLLVRFHKCHFNVTVTGDSCHNREMSVLNFRNERKNSDLKLFTHKILNLNCFYVLNSFLLAHNRS